MVRTLFVAVMLVGAAATAQPEAAKPDAEAKAKELFMKGNDLLEDGDTRGALAMYKSAYAHFPNPKLLLNMGTLLKRLGRNAEAANVYEQYLSEQGFDAQRAPEVAKALAELEPLVGRLRIESQPESHVFVDEDDVGVLTQPKTVRVEPGSHTIKASQDGYEPFTLSVTVAAGEELPIAITLQASEAVATGPRSAQWPESGVDADALARFQVEPIEEESPLNHSGHVGLIARSETDIASGGTGSAFGATVGIGSYLEGSATALIQRDTGLRLAMAVWLAPDSAAKPFLRLGAPMFFGDSETSAGIHAGGGLVWDIAPRYGVDLDLAVEHFPSVPDAREKTAVVLGIGLHVRLF